MPMPILHLLRLLGICCVAALLHRVHHLGRVRLRHGGWRLRIASLLILGWHLLDGEFRRRSTCRSSLRCKKVLSALWNSELGLDGFGPRAWSLPILCYRIEHWVLLARRWGHAIHRLSTIRLV